MSLSYLLLNVGRFLEAGSDLLVVVDGGDQINLVYPKQVGLRSSYKYCLETTRT